MNQRPFLARIALVVKRYFYIFLDISGILLGIFLAILGLWITAGRNVSGVIGIIILVIGVAAFLIHTGHYYSWKITKWIFGADDYFLTRKKTDL